jgi:hypothetical protein
LEGRRGVGDCLSKARQRVEIVEIAGFVCVVYSRTMTLSFARWVSIGRQEARARADSDLRRCEPQRIAVLRGQRGRENKEG